MILSCKPALCAFAVALVAGQPWVLAAANDESQSSSEETAAHPSRQPKESEPDQEPRQPRQPREPRQPTLLFEQLLVIGAPEEARRVPGSAHVITKEDLERQGYADIHRVLRQTPGLNIQEEDGYGLRPNIGIRGTGVERSRKITLLEDGVLIAPAPYSAPAAYYSPTAGRMEGFEIRKGSGAIRQGPQTNGGAINYLSTRIPNALSARISISAGEEGFVRSRAVLGDSRERFGWLLETFRLETDGFKHIDGAGIEAGGARGASEASAGTQGRGGTGFDLEDYLGKFRINSPLGADVYQALEIKLGKTEQIGNETYLGLTQDDFDRDPFRRYAASAGDKITTHHEQMQLSYYLRPNSRWNLTATVYRNDFFRNWFKLERIDGNNIADVLASPAEFSDLLSILRGDSDSEPGALQVRNNRRDYFSEGIQLVLGLELTVGGVGHEVEIGLRQHRDQEDRFQEEDGFQMVDGRRRLTARGAPGSNANRIASAEATALFVQDTFSLGRWTWTPGVRIESIDLMRRDFGKADPGRIGTVLAVRENGLTEVIPGVGLGYQLNSDSNLFFGVHRGFSPPSPSSTQDVESEESVNYEFGWRYSSGGTSAELVGFFSDYANLLGNDTVSSGGQGTGNQFNGGEVEVKGVEVGMTMDLARGLSTRVRLPFRLAYTYTAAEFRNSFESDFADWQPRVLRGDQLSYIPQSQLYAGLSVEAARWAVHLDGSYSDEMRTRPGTGPIPEKEIIDSRFLLDLRLEFRMREHMKVWAQLLNLTDEVYVVARRPAGLRPGRPRAALFGVSFGFLGGSSGG